MTYAAPSKVASEYFGVTLHDDWGLNGHALLQTWLLPTGKVQDGYDEDLVEEIIGPFAWAEKYHGFDRYHIALGMISQFNRDDIEYFVNVHYPNRPKDIEERTEALRRRYCGFHGNPSPLQWVLSEPTLSKLERHLEKESSMKFYRIEYGDCDGFKARNLEQTCEWATTKRDAQLIAKENDDGDYKSRITEIDVPTDKAGLLAFLNWISWR